MQVEITFLTQRGTAAIRRSGRVTTERLRFGRGTNNEVSLADIRVPLSAAVLYQGQDGLFIEKSGDLPLRINGQPAEGAIVRAGDEIGIGPYRILLGEPPAGLDAAFSVELARPIGDSLQRIVERSSIGLEATHLSKRRPSWVLFLVLIAAALVAPIVAYLVSARVTAPTAVPPGLGTAGVFRASWNPGELSNAHRSFAGQCTTCHQSPFTAVKDSACLTCHSGIGAHVPATQAAGIAALHTDLQKRRCTDCHVEHRGLNSLVIREGALCVQCHRSLAQKAPAAGVPDVSGFPDGHPQFRATVVANADAAKPILKRVPVGPAPVPADRPGVIFSHEAHLRPYGFPVLDIKPMVCSQCHVPEPSGQGFRPITFDGQCKSCHRLEFEGVPHGDDLAVAGAVEGFYAAQVVRHGVPTPPPTQIERHLPGSPPAAAPLGSAQAWVAQQTRARLAVIFASKHGAISKQGCFYCHVADPKLGQFRVAPVRMLVRFLPMARFDHASHRALACEDCHAARQSQSSADLLIPGIGRCTTCHGGESAAFKAESTCVSCHLFHRPELGLMRRTAGLSTTTGTQARPKR